MSMCHICYLLSQLTDFHETCYQDYAIRGYPDVVVLNSYNTSMRDGRTSEMGTTSGT
jgi:hypothetical protein